MKKRICTRAFCLLLCLLLAIPLVCLPLSADAPPLPDTSGAKAVLLYHLDRNEVVLSSNADALLPAASTVKVLSGLLFCELLASRLQESVTVTREMVYGASGQCLGLKEGDVLTVEELLYASVCLSYNDAFCVLACLVAQTVEGFANLMNQRADALGLTKSEFREPVGTSDTSFTTAAELAAIAAAAYQNALYMQICGTAEYYLPYLSKTKKNKNEMIAAGTTYDHYNNKCNGMNAGSTTLGGDCIVASVSNGRESYVCIVLGCAESDRVENNQAYRIANRLTDWVYSTYQSVEIISPDTVICKIPVTVSDLTTEVEVRTDQTRTAYLPYTAEIGKEITYSIRLSQTELEAPVTEGTFVGYVAILYQGTVLDTVPLYTAGAAERSSFVSLMQTIQDLFVDRRVLSGLIFFAVVLTAWIAFEILYKRYKHHRWDKYFSNKIDTTKRHR